MTSTTVAGGDSSYSKQEECHLLAIPLPIDFLCRRSNDPIILACGGLREGTYTLMGRRRGQFDLIRARTQSSKDSLMDHTVLLRRLAGLYKYELAALRRTVKAGGLAS